MKQEIKKIANILPGYTFRSAVEPDPRGDTWVFQAKDVVQGVPFNTVSSLTKISHTVSGKTGRLEKNDIILVARGMKTGTFRSTTFVADSPHVIASSSVYIIRLARADCIPEYVSLYLNSKAGQNALTGIVSGSFVGVLPKHRLEELEIPLPTREKQKMIIDVHQNIRAQELIVEHQQLLKRDILDALFRTITT